MQKISEIEQHLLFFIDFLRVPKYRVRPIAVMLAMWGRQPDISQLGCLSTNPGKGQ